MYPNSKVKLANILFPARYYTLDKMGFLVLC